MRFCLTLFLSGLPEEMKAYLRMLEQKSESVSCFEATEGVKIQAFFKEKPDSSLIQEDFSILSHLLGREAPSFTLEEVEDKNWLEEVYRLFPPQTIGRYFIYGSHFKGVIPQEQEGLHIDAATAFGSGEHESTRGCLLMLDELASKGDTFQNCLDMGCGSGILAMAMAKTWQGRVIACDEDEEAVLVTQVNTEKNLCSSNVVCFQSRSFSDARLQENGPYDLITANILAQPLCDMAEDLVKVLEKGGYLILSGLLDRQVLQILEAYKEIRLVSDKTIHNWATLLLKKDEE